MFKPKDTQTTIFQTHLYLPDKLRNRLKELWAEIFRKDIMPIIPVLCVKFKRDVKLIGKLGFGALCFNELPVLINCRLT
jgi:hypothetical protein